jgi:hypothetical protein
MWAVPFNVVVGSEANVASPHSMKAGVASVEQPDVTSSL